MSEPIKFAANSSRVRSTEFLPATLAIVDSDTELAQHLAQQLALSGVSVSVFANSDDLITSNNAFGYGFYVTDLEFPGIDGFALIRLIRRRTASGVLVLSSRAVPADFELALQCGADMFLTKPVRLEQAMVGIQAIERRCHATSHQLAIEWKLDTLTKQLETPGGLIVDLSPTDAVLMDCFLEAKGKLVTHDQIKTVLGLPADAESDNALHAAIYRLKRRIERATSLNAPLQSQSRSGYVFKANLITC